MVTGKRNRKRRRTERGESAPPDSDPFRDAEFEKISLSRQAKLLESVELAAQNVGLMRSACSKPSAILFTTKNRLARIASCAEIVKWGLQTLKRSGRAISFKQKFEARMTDAFARAAFRSLGLTPFAIRSNRSLD
jgi:hypothetical protein